MADLGNQLEDTSSSLERLTDGFDNLMIRMTSSSTKESKMLQEKLAISKQLGKIEAAKFKEEKKAIPLRKKMTQELQTRLKSTTLLNKGLKETIKGMKLFEKGMGGMKKGLGTVGKGIAAIGKAGIIGGLVVGVKFLIDGLLKVDNAMADLVKRTKMTRTELAGVREAALAAAQSVSLMGPSFEEITAEAGNLVQAFGNAHMVSEQLIKDSLALQQGYGIAAQQAGELTEALERTNRSGQEFRQSMENIARKSGVSVALLMRDMAQRSQQISIQNERSTESMAKMAASALKMGTSMEAFDGLKGAFQDIDNIQDTMANAQIVFGDEFVKIMGTSEELQRLNFQGAKGQEIIQKRIEKALKATTTEQENGNIVLNKSGKLWSNSEGSIDLIAKTIGLTNVTMNKMTRTQKELTAAQKEERDEAERLETIYRDQLGVLQYFQKIVTSVFGKITAAFSEALGIDSSEGGVRGLLKTLETDMENIFQFKTLQADIASGGGGFGGFIKAMMKRLDPLVEYISDKLMQGLEKGFSWISNNVEMDVMGALAGGPLITTKGGKAASALESVRGQKTNLGFGEEMKFSDFAGSAGAAKEQAGALGKGQYDFVHEELKKMGFKTDVEQEWAAALLDKGKAAQDVKIREFRKIEKDAMAGIDREIEKAANDKNLNKEQKKAATLHWQAVQEEIKQGGMLLTQLKRRAAIERELAAAEDAAAKEEAQRAAALRYATKEAKAFRAEGQEKELEGEALAALVAKLLPKHLEEQGIATVSALGRIGGGLSIVGEAGGEVIASRSALRSGIGIGGRAASALAGIGVPGYQAGTVRSSAGVTGREGLMGAQGSQAFRQAKGVAFQEEQARQQASMMEYWRRTYEKKMDDMIDEKAKKQPEPPWLATFFQKYNKQIGSVLDKTLGKKAFGKEMTTAIMTGMTKWSQGGSLKEAMMLGAKAGITAGLNDKDSSLYKLLESQGAMGDIAKAGLTAFAQGKSVKRAVIGAGARSLASYLQSKNTFDMGSYLDERAAKKAKDKKAQPKPTKAKPTAPSSSGGGNMYGLPGFAEGRYVNSPTLAMIGETGEGEIVIPTERIRKGLPINKGVANELASIGVPGYFNGYFGAPAATASKAPEPEPEAEPEAEADKPKAAAKMGLGGSMALQGAATGLVDFANVYEQTGDWKQAASAGVGGGIGAAAGMGLTAMGIPPPLSTMAGQIIGGLATKGINKIFKLTGGYGEGRKAVMKKFESHIKTGGRFDFGAPSGMTKSMGQAIGGYERTPTQANFDKMVEDMAGSSLIASMGVPAPVLIALAQGKTTGGAATKLYRTINTSLYGSGADKYRKALSIPSLAAGGIVNRPTTAVIGERGPEAVVPLGDSEMVQELKKQNKLMTEMIKTQKETAKTEIRMDGRLVSEAVGQNFYDIGNGL